MNSLGLAIAALAYDIHPDTALAIADALEKNPQDSPMPVLRGFLGSTTPNHLIAIEIMIDHGRDVTSRDVANMIRGAAAANVLKNREEIELVWTGPATGIVPIRRTEQVMTGLIEASRQELFIVSFVAYDALLIMEAMTKASSRGVKVRILMERSQSQGGTLNFDAIGKVRSAVPSAEFYIWDNETPSFGKAGSVHAKCAVADGESAFITSANLTGAAMDRNMELGVLVRGGELPKQLLRHLQALLTTRTITRIGE
jgi:cardiolipin synthase